MFSQHLMYANNMLVRCTNGDESSLSKATFDTDVHVTIAGMFQLLHNFIFSLYNLVIAYNHIMQSKFTFTFMQLYDAS